MQILGLIVVGLIIGALARLLQPGRQRMSILATMLLGVVGAIIGGLIADWLDVGSITELNFWGFLFALLAAVLLVGVAEGVAAGRNRAVR
ncbi:GlsB/YeaQ/YmgE family stress response membrane protein [Geodermatophilus sp. URMC 60]